MESLAPRALCARPAAAARPPARCESSLGASSSSRSASVQLLRRAPRRVRLTSRAGARAGPETETEGSPLDFPEEWVKANPSRRPDIFPEFKPMKPALPQPMPGDPEVPDEFEEDEKQKKKKKPGEPPDKDKPDKEDDPDEEPDKKPDKKEEPAEE